MAEYLIQDTTLTSIANEVRTLSGTEETLSPEAMKEKVAEGNENIAAEADLIAQIQAALEGKSGNNNTDMETCSVTLNLSGSIQFVCCTTIVNNILTPYYYIDSGTGEAIYELIIENILCGSTIGIKGQVSIPIFSLAGGVESIDFASGHFIFKAPVESKMGYINIQDDS